MNEQIEKKILKVIKNNPGINIEGISQKTGLNRTTVARYSDRLSWTNQVRRETEGMSKKHFIIESEGKSRS